MSERLRVGVIGGGQIAQTVHLPLLASSPEEYEPVAIADPSPVVREALARRYGGLAAHADWRSLLETPGLDAVVICSPQHNHAEAVLAALDLGIHAMVEKPLCIDPADAERICRRQEETGLVVQVGYMKRYDEAYRAFIEGLPAGGEALRLIEVVTRDPGMARRPFLPRDFVTATDVPETVSKVGKEAESRQVEAAVGRGDPATVKAFSYTYLACLVHDVNLIHGALERLGVELPLPALSAADWAEGLGAAVTYRLPQGGLWHCSWVLLEDLEVFHEDAALYFADGIHRLAFDAPYLRERPTVLTRTAAAEGVETTTSMHHGNDAFAAELLRFHACITEGAECLTPPQQALLDLVALRDGFLAGVRSGAAI